MLSENEQPQNSVALIPVFETLDAKIATIPRQFELTPDVIQKAVQQYSVLEIAGINDKAGYKKAEQGISLLRTMRTTVEKDRKSQKEEALKYGRAVDAHAKELTALIMPAESRLKEKVLAIDEEKERIEWERLQQEIERLQARVKQMNATGAAFDGVNFTLGCLIISLAEVKLNEQEQFESVLQHFQEQAEKFKQIEQRNEEERQRIKREHSELLKQRTAAREKQLQELGMTLDAGAGLYYFRVKDFEGFSVTLHHLLDLNDFRWSETIINVTDSISKLRQKQAEFDAKQAQQPESLTKENEVSQEAKTAFEMDCTNLLPWLNDLNEVLLRIPKIETKDLEPLIAKVAAFQAEVSESIFVLQVEI